MVPFPSSQGFICCLASFCSVRNGVLHPGIGSLRLQYRSKRLDLQHRDWAVCCCFCQWVVIFCLEFWYRRYADTVPHTAITSMLISLVGGTPAQTWAFRACVIQGTQQIYVAFLWYWGAMLSRANSTTGPPVSAGTVTAITTPIAILMWAAGIVLYFGLPNYYRRHPGHVPSFYKSLFRRKTVIVSLKSALQVLPREV